VWLTNPAYRWVCNCLGYPEWLFVPWEENSENRNLQNLMDDSACRFLFSVAKQTICMLGNVPVYFFFHFRLAGQQLFGKSSPLLLHHHDENYWFRVCMDFRFYDFRSASVALQIAWRKRQRPQKEFTNYGVKNDWWRLFGWQLLGWPKNEKLMAFPTASERLLMPLSFGCPNRNCGLNG